MDTKLYVVLPCYNEEEVLGETSKRLLEKFNSLISANIISPLSRIVFVDDGSRDKTWEIVENLHRQSEYFEGIKLSHNRGHQNALLAGLFTVNEFADCIITMDADLQDDINVMDTFLEKYHDGCDVVYGVRDERNTDTFLKRSTSLLFYKIMAKLGVESIYNHADYRLMSKRAVAALAEYKEVNLFLRGMVPLIGFKSDNVYYNRDSRFAGESKYPFSKLLNFAVNGITSFSVKPLRLITALGFFVVFLSILGILYALISYIMDVVVPGWTATVVSIWFLGGVQMMCLGVVGEYVGKIYSETKGRPRFTVETFLHSTDNKA